LEKEKKDHFPKKKKKLKKKKENINPFLKGKYNYLSAPSPPLKPPDPALTDRSSEEPPVACASLLSAVCEAVASTAACVPAGWTSDGDGDGAGDSGGSRGRTADEVDSGMPEMAVCVSGKVQDGEEAHCRSEVDAEMRRVDGPVLRYGGMDTPSVLCTSRSARVPVSAPLPMPPPTLTPIPASTPTPTPTPTPMLALIPTSVAVAESATDTLGSDGEEDWKDGDR
jgi:hypothetical protein